MRDLFPAILRWRDEGRQIVLARVVSTSGPSPRGPGAAMAVADDGSVLGSVSGGCVEGAVVQEAADVLVTGRPRVVTYGHLGDELDADEQALATGLTCGGAITLFIEPFDW